MSKASIGRAARAVTGSSPPQFVAPLLATSRKIAPTGTQWVHEVKLDGYRLMARIENGSARLLTRSGLDWTERFGPIAGELAAWNVKSAMLDGEATVLTGAGLSDFGALVAALKGERRHAISYLAFDLLFLDGQDLRAKPLMARKAALGEVLKRQGQAKLVCGVDCLEGDGPALLAAACAMGLEGIVSKRRHSQYRSGRQPSWVKVKCATSDDFAIVGYLASKADARAVGALVVAERIAKEGVLTYAGRVGTGYTAEAAIDLKRRLDELALERRPIDVPTGTDVAGVVWVDPRLTARVHFRERTADGILRHAVFKGLREAD